jgi:Na+-translocating ferredoxin:NAD+ oxidoreductase RnfC subunit
MSTLATLKLTAAVKPTNIPAVQVRRNKLVKRLWEQVELAKAHQAGTQFAPVKFRTIKDKETGLRKTVEVNKRVNRWWFTAENGKLALSVRYGARLLELAKGKFAVEVASEKELVPTLEVIKAAVLDGLLDSAIDAASNKLRAGFTK